MSTTAVPMGAIPVDLDFSTAEITLLEYQFPAWEEAQQTPASFSDYIETLDEWERELLQEVEINDDVYVLVSAIISHASNSDGEILATSDGSAPNFVGTFGWSLSLSNGKRLAKNKGPAPGHRTTSFRAEAYGLLSLLRFLFHAFAYTGNTLPDKLTLHTDSESVLKKLLEMATWPYYYPNTTIASDWDVLQAVITAKKQYPPTMKLVYVRGHQDKKIPFRDLSLPAQLNVEADALAGVYVYRKGTDRTRVPIIVGNALQLHIWKELLRAIAVNSYAR